MSGVAAIYARISEDRDGDAAGVERQVEDAQALAAARGFEVFGTYIDNDRSAYSGRARPEWGRLLADLETGTIMHVVAWANDRLYRRTRDQLALMEAVRLAGGTIATVKDGDVDPASAEGRMRMGILANVAEFESARKAERVARASEQRAAAGKPHGRAAFGWRSESSGWVLDTNEAAMVREAAARVLRGEACGQIVDDWNTRGLPTANGAERWDHRALRRILRRPANAGLRVHRGRIVGPSTAPAILDGETWEAVVVTMKGNGQRRPRRYLLTSIVHCGEDGQRMVGHAAKNRGYECVACHRRIAADRLDAEVATRVLEELATPRLARRLASARSDRKEAEALRDLERADARLAEIAALYGAGEIEVAEYRVARQAAQERRTDAERRLTTRRSSRVVGDVLASEEGIAALWERQPVTWRREVIQAVIERIEIGQSTRPAWEPGRAGITWR